MERGSLPSPNLQGRHYVTFGPLMTLSHALAGHSIQVQIRTLNRVPFTPKAWVKLFMLPYKITQKLGSLLVLASHG